MKREVVSVVVGEKDKPRRANEPIVVTYSDDTEEKFLGSYFDAEHAAEDAGVDFHPTPNGIVRWVREGWETYTEDGQTKVRPRI